MDITVSDIFDEAGRLEEERAKKLVPLAKDVVMVLVKTIKATRMYLPNNPIYQKFYDELLEKLRVFFDEEEMLSFLVNRFELTFMGQQVYQNPDKEDNLALMFFKDGIREFCFHKGITPEEAHGFIDILKTDVKDMELDNDLVTLLWEKDFSCITYTVTDEATDEEAGEEEALLSFEEEPDALRELDALQRSAPGPAGKQGAGLGPGGEGGPGGTELLAGYSDDTASLAEDYESIRGSFTAPDDLSLLTELTDIFYEILVTEKENELFDMVADSLTRALEIFVKRGDLALATILVMKVQELAGRPDIAERGEKLQRFLEKARSRELVVMVGEFIDQGGPEAMESAGSYLMQLDLRALTNMVGLLETLENRKARKALADIIAGICASNGKPLTEFLGHRFWFVARNIAMILCKVADPDTLPALGGALKHQEPRVRREVIHALGALKSDKADGLLSEAISDADRHNRALAVRLLTERSPLKAFDRLLALVSDKKFDDLGSEEKRELLEFLGRAGKEQAIPFLAGKFGKKGFFAGMAGERNRVCAAYGLAAAGGEEAAALLKVGANSKSKTLRDACTDALRRMAR
jgi:hypothetical protein